MEFLSHRKILTVHSQKQIRSVGEELLNRIIDKPIKYGGTLVKMEAVSGIDYFGTLVAGRSRSQTGNHATHRGMTMNDVVIFFIQEFF